MLVLGRKMGEQIIIGGQVVVTVLEARGDRIRLGFEAPPEVPIHRAEVVKALSSEKPPTCPAGQPRRNSDEHRPACQTKPRPAACVAT